MKTAGLFLKKGCRYSKRVLNCGYYLWSMKYRVDFLLKREPFCKKQGLRIQKVHSFTKRESDFKYLPKILKEQCFASPKGLVNVQKVVNYGL
jgi:hypothetical protein